MGRSQVNEQCLDTIAIPGWQYAELIAIKDRLETVKIIVEKMECPRNVLALILGVNIEEDKETQWEMS